MTGRRGRPRSVAPLSGDTSIAARKDEGDLEFGLWLQARVEMLLEAAIANHTSGDEAFEAARRLERLKNGVKRDLIQRQTAA